MAEEIDSKVDKYDWMYFVAGGLVTLVALYLIKHILEPQHHWYEQHHHHHHQGLVPISKEVEKVYKMDYSGKMY